MALAVQLLPKSLRAAIDVVSIVRSGGVQNLEWSNVERPIFRNFKITNIKTSKDKLIDYFIYEFISNIFF